MSIDAQEKAVAETYLPVFMTDRNEPFRIQAIGYTVFHGCRRSDSFPKRIIEMNACTETCVIEYAIWFDYDIQHLYELEHVWVYVDEKGTVSRVEGSFHGKYLNLMDLDTGKPILNAEGRLIVWMQPGKHALLPDPRLVKIVPMWRECCMEFAGAEGLDMPDAFRGWLPLLSEKDDRKVCEYIRKRYAFEPSLLFEEMRLGEDVLMPWSDLKRSIPDRIAKELRKIGVDGI